MAPPEKSNLDCPKRKLIGMIEQEPVYTVGRSLRMRLTVKKSRFIVSLAPADTKREVLEFIDSIQAEFPDATHHTYAYRLGFGEKQIDRSSDAREPAGTAGPPMLQELSSAGVTNAVIVVTRYFGGIKLGIGGLTRAYRSCARACLEEARLVEIKPREFLAVSLDYDDLGPAVRYIESCEGKIEDMKYAERVKVTFSVPVASIKELIAGLGEVTRGRAVMVELPPP